MRIIPLTYLKSNPVGLKVHQPETLLSAHAAKVVNLSIKPLTWSQKFNFLGISRHQKKGILSKISEKNTKPLIITENGEIDKISCPQHAINHSYIQVGKR